MAFSTFRGLMAASIASSAPALSDIYGSELPCTLYVSTAAARNGWIAQGTSSEYYAVGTTGNAKIAFIIARNVNHASYAYIDNTFQFASISGTSQFQCCDMIDSAHFLVVYDIASTTISGNYIVNSSGNLSSGASGTATTNNSGGTTLNFGLCAVLDSTDALVFGGSTSANTDNTISLINPTNFTSYGLANASAVNVSSGQVGLFKIDATRGALCWNNSGIIYINTIDIVSNTSITLHTAVNTGITSSNAYGVLYGLSHTSALMVYYKSANTIAVRTVTFGSGGAITLNTEYTTSAPNISSYYAPFRIANYGTTYVIGYGGVGPSANYYGGLIYASGVTVNGNVVTFDSMGFSIISTAGNYHAGSTAPIFPFNAGMFIPMSSTTFSYAAPTALSTAGANVVVTGVVDVNPTIHTWGAPPSLSSGGYTYTLSTATGATLSWLGTNRLIVSGSAGGSNDLLFYAVDSGAGTSAHMVPNTTTFVTTSVAAGVSAMSILGYDTTNGLGRMLSAYASASNTISFQVLSSDQQGDLTANTSSTLSVTGIGTATNGLFNLIPLASDTSMFIGYNSVPAAYYAAVVTTSTEAVSVIGAYSSIYQVLGQTPGTAAQFIQWSVIDSARVALLVLTQATVGGTWSLNAVILGISGSTITPGTSVNLFSGHTNPPATYGVSTLGNGTGIIVYTNDANPGTNILANGFTYSGTAITLGTQSTANTGLNISAAGMIGNGNQNLIRCSNTEAILIYNAGGAITLCMLVYSGINSIASEGVQTVGTPTTLQSFGLISTDNYNNTFGTYYTDSSSSHTLIDQWYR